MGTTKDIREAVNAELNFDPLVDDADIHVVNINGDAALLVTGLPDPFRTYHVPPKLVSAWPLATPGPESPEKV